MPDRAPRALTSVHCILLMRPYVPSLGMATLEPSFDQLQCDEHPESLATKTTTKPPVAFLPYVAGISERIQRVCRDFGIRVVFKSGPTLRSLLTKVKDPLPTEKQSSVVYEVPCTCGKVYIGKTKLRLGTHLKEHKDACAECLTNKSAIAEHSWTSDHPINWNGTKILQRAGRTMQLVLKEALSIHKTPEDARFNRESGYELPDCLIATYNKLRSGASFSSARWPTRGAHNQACAN